MIYGAGTWFFAGLFVAYVFSRMAKACSDEFEERLEALEDECEARQSGDETH